jgi:hypothetical protein
MVIYSTLNGWHSTQIAANLLLERSSALSVQDCNRANTNHQRIIYKVADTIQSIYNPLTTHIYRGLEIESAL